MTERTPQEIDANLANNPVKMVFDRWWAAQVAAGKYPGAGDTERMMALDAFSQGGAHAIERLVQKLYGIDLSAAYEERHDA